MSKQPTILVKKADGTTVRMTLDEVKKMNAGNKVAPPPEPKIATVEQESVSEKAQEMLKTPELEPAPTEYLLPEPHLLHEEVEEHEVTKPELVAAVSYDDTIEQILKTAKLSPNEEMLSRYRSLIMSLLKGVRTVDQIMVYATAPQEKGGLALSKEEAARLQGVLETTSGVPKVAPKPIAKLANNPSTQPKNNPLPRPAGSGAGRVPMTDVEAPPRPAQAIMGPIEEMKQFSLVDWRRLAATPDKAKEILLGKFAGWKEESFFLYRDTRAAWLESPLIREYQEKVVNAINNSTRLADLATGFAAKNTLTPADIAALVEVNRALAV